MRILCFGDSITQGFHDPEIGGWTNRLAAHVMQKEVASDYEYNRSVVNLGVSGDTSADVVKRIKTETEARVLKYPTDHYDVLLLAVGANDSMFHMDTKENQVSLAVTIENIEQTIASVKELLSKVVLVGVAPVYDDRVQPMAWLPTHGYSNIEIDRYNDALKAFAVENNYQWIDMGNVYEGREAEVLPDGIHPNAEGHRLVYEQIKLALEETEIL